MSITPNTIIIIIIVLLVLILVVGAVLFLLVNKQNVDEQANSHVMNHLTMLPGQPDDIERTAPLDDFETTERIICFSESREAITGNGSHFTIEYELSFTGSTEVIE